MLKKIREGSSPTTFTTVESHSHEYEEKAIVEGDVAYFSVRCKLCGKRHSECRKILRNGVWETDILLKF